MNVNARWRLRDFYHLLPEDLTLSKEMKMTTLVTLVFITVMSDSLGCAELLLKAGSSTEISDSNHGCTPLLVAVSKSSVKMVKLLVQYGADLRVTDTDGNNPLQYAAVYGGERAEMPLSIGCCCQHNLTPEDP